MRSPRPLLPIFLAAVLAATALWALGPGLGGADPGGGLTAAERARAEAEELFASSSSGGARPVPAGAFASRGAASSDRGSPAPAGLTGSRAAGLAEASAPRGGASAREAVGPPPGARMERTWVAEVRSGARSQPVVGAEVRLRLGDERSSASTDADGRFAIAWFEDLPGDLEIEHDEFVDLRIASHVLEDDARFQLTSSGALAGRLVGLPLGIAAGEQRVELWRSSSQRGRDWERSTVQVDLEGGFRFEDLDPGEYALCAFGDGIAGRYEAGVRVGEGAEVWLELSCTEATELAGELVFGTGLVGPTLEGTEVEVAPRDKDLPRVLMEERRRTAVADSLGSFELDQLAPGAYRVVISPPWGGRRIFGLDIDASGERLEREFELSPPASLAGRVLDAQGEPAAGVVVAAHRAKAKLDLGSAPEALPGGTVTDRDGRFRLEVVPAKESILVLARPPSGSDSHLPAWSETLQLAPAEQRTGVELRFPAELFVSGRIERAMGTGQVGDHLEGALVQARFSQAGRETVLASARSDEDGSYRLGPLLPGWNRISASLEGYLDASQSLDLLPGAETAVDLQLEPAWSLRGRVVDEAGAGVPKLRLVASVIDPELPRKQRRERTELDPPDRSTHTDEYGRFVLRELPPADWFLGLRGGTHELVRRSHRVVGEAEAREELELVVRRLARPERAGLDLLVLSGATGLPPENLEVKGLGAAQVTIDGGEVHATGVEPGPVRVLVTAKGCASTYLDTELLPGIVTDLGLVQLQAGARVVVDVTGPSDKALTQAKVRLTPLPADEGGPQPAGGWAGDEPPPTLTLQHLGGGRYRVDGVPHGAWRLRVTDQGKQTHRETLQVDRDRLDRDVELRVQRDRPTAVR